MPYDMFCHIIVRLIPSASGPRPVFFTGQLGSRSRNTQMSMAQTWCANASANLI